MLKTNLISMIKNSFRFLPDRVVKQKEVLNHQEIVAYLELMEVLDNR